MSQSTIVRVGDTSWPQQIRLESYERGSNFKVTFEVFNASNGFDPCTDPVLGTPKEFPDGTTLEVRTFVENDQEPASTDPADIALYRATWRVAMAGVIEFDGDGTDPAVVSVFALPSSMERGFLPGSLYEIRIHVFTLRAGARRQWLEMVLPLEDVGF